MSELMWQGINLTLYGMGMVFFFLTFLVMATMMMSILLRDEIQPVEIEPEYSGNQPEGTDSKIVAAITAAVHQYRRNQ